MALGSPKSMPGILKSERQSTIADRQEKDMWLLVQSEGLRPNTEGARTKGGIFLEPQKWSQPQTAASKIMVVLVVPASQLG